MTASLKPTRISQISLYIHLSFLIPFITWIMLKFELLTILWSKVKCFFKINWNYLYFSTTKNTGKINTSFISYKIAQRKLNKFRINTYEESIDIVQYIDTETIHITSWFEHLKLSMKLVKVSIIHRRSLWWYCWDTRSKRRKPPI